MAFRIHYAVVGSLLFVLPPGCHAQPVLRVPLEGPSRNAAARCVSECRALRESKSRRELRFFVACIKGCPGGTVTRTPCRQEEHPPSVYCAEVTPWAGVDEAGHLQSLKESAASTDGGTAGRTAQ